MKNKTNILNKFLAFSSGYDEELLQYCPDYESKKAYTLGAINLLSLVSSIIALIFAFQFITKNYVISIFFAFLIGTAIFSFNRLIVISKRRLLTTINAIFTLGWITLSVLSTLLIFYPLMIIILKTNLNSSEDFFLNMKEINSMIFSNGSIRFTATILGLLLIIVDLMPLIAQFLITPNMRVYEDVMYIKEKKSLERAYDRINMEEKIEPQIDIVETIKHNIYDNDLRSAINYLNLLIDANMLEEERNELIALLYRIRRLRNDFAHNTIDDEFASRELNYLKMNLLLLLDRMKNKNNLNIPKIDNNILTDN